MTGALINGLCDKKPCHMCFQPGLTQPGCNVTKECWRLEILDKEKRVIALGLPGYRLVGSENIKADLSCALICTFDITYAKCKFSHDAAQIYELN